MNKDFVSENLIKRLIGFAYIEKTEKGDPKIQIVIENVKGFGKIRIMGLFSKSGKILRLYRSAGKNQESFETIQSNERKTQNEKSAFHNSKANSFAEELTE